MALSTVQSKICADLSGVMRLDLEGRWDYYAKMTGWFLLMLGMALLNAIAAAWAGLPGKNKDFLCQI